MTEAERHQKYILLADDNEALRSSLESLLIDLGHHVIAVSDGKKALDIFEKYRKQLCLIITDISMPILDGFSLIRQVRQSDKELPIMAISGCPDHTINTTQDALVKHDIPLFFKPFSFDSFVGHLESTLSYA